MKAHTYVVGIDSMHHQAGTIIVTPATLPHPDFEWKGTREVSRGFFPLLGVVASGSFRVFSCWEDLEHEFEADGFKLAVE